MGYVVQNNSYGLVNILVIWRECVRNSTVHLSSGGITVFLRYCQGMTYSLYLYIAVFTKDTIYKVAVLVLYIGGPVCFTEKLRLPKTNDDFLHDFLSLSGPRCMGRRLSHRTVDSDRLQGPVATATTLSQSMVGVAGLCAFSWLWNQTRIRS